MGYKPRTIDKWPISDDAKKVAKRELKKWVDLLVEQADGREGNVFRFDIIKEDFFYFTNCNDILKDDPEYKAHETNDKIVRRKIRVFMQLVLKQIMGEKLGKVLKCTHCGKQEEMRKMTNGHFRYCPHCKKVSFVGYVPTLQDSVDSILEQVKEESK